MTISHLLESFDGFQGSSVSLSEDSLEDQKLDSFERGYKAGWDDSAKAQQDDSTRVTSDFASNIQDLSFTYHEAYSHMVKSMKPLLQQIVDAVLPEIARKTFGIQVSEQLHAIAEKLVGQEIEVVVSPNNADAMQGMLEQDFNLTVSMVIEPSLGEGQAYLRFGQSERQINMDEVLSGVNIAIEAYFHEIEKETGNG